MANNRPITMHIYIEWRVNAQTESRFFELMSQYDELTDDDPARDGIVEEIRRLPGFPANAPIDSDFLLIPTYKTIH